MSPGQWVDFRAVKEAVSLEAVLGHYRVDWLKRSGREQLRGRCPIHQRGGEGAFHASLTKNAFRCFYCQAGGNVLDFVAAMENCSVRQAALRLQEWFGVGGRAQQRTSAGHRGGELVPRKGEGNRLLGFALRGVDGSHPYLRERGIEPATARHFGVGYFGGRGVMRGRIVIPVQDEQGRNVAYCGRSLDGTAPRYKLPAGFQRSLVLFNLHRAVASGEETVIVVEGFFDCMKVHQAGFPHVVALMGSTLSEDQERLLLKHFRRVVLFLDGDQAGRRAQVAIAARLAGQCGLRVAELPTGEQPDRLSSGQIRRLLNQEGRV